MEMILVEDDLIVTRLHKWNINNFIGITPTDFLNGKEAVNYLDEQARRSKNFLVLLDLNMPVMNGWEFLEICHSRSYANRIYIVVVTSSSYKLDSERARKYDRVVGYYQKPLTIEKLSEIFSLKEIAELVQ